MAMSAGSTLRLFGLGSTVALADRVAAALGIARSAHEERDFEDGEHKARPLESVRGDDVFVLHSLHGEPGQSANDKLVRLLFFLATLRDHGAARITAVAPYLCYARKDRRTKPHDPVALRYVAQLFESVGTQRVVAMEVHNPAAFENAFRCGTTDLEAVPLFVARLAPELRGREVTVLSPDAGGFKRAQALREALGVALDRPVELGLMEKHRSAGEVSGERLFADVHGRHVVIVDDLVSTGGTLLRAARAARAAGAASVQAVATHGLFVEDAGESLAGPALDGILVTDSVPPFRLHGRPAMERVEVLPCAPLIAQAIRGLRGREGPDSGD